MVTALTPGYLYVCDWIDNAADADAQDLDSGTVGTNYFYLEDPKLYRVNRRQGGKDPKYYEGGKSWGFRDGSISGQVFFQGYVSSRTVLDYIENYIISNGNTANTIKSNPDYLFIPYAAADWHTFRDEGAAQQEYAKGWFRDYKVVADMEEYGRYMVTIEFWVMWD